MACSACWLVEVIFEKGVQEGVAASTCMGCMAKAWGEVISVECKTKSRAGELQRRSPVFRVKSDN